MHYQIISCDDTSIRMAPGQFVDHSDRVWPNSHAAIERQMAPLTPEMRKELTRGNAAALYGLK